MAAVLVTGGAGYIGAHICKRLAASGILPVTLDDMSTGHADAVRFGPLVEGSIADEVVLRELRRRYRLIAVLHAAALSDAAESVHQAERYRRVNVEATAALRSVFAGLPLVFSSSAAVYGHADGAITEDRLPVPLNPYGVSKLEAEGLLSDAMRLRYFNVAGADPDIGPGHKPETHLISRLLRVARDGGVFTIQGDGDAVRDFVHVSDVAEANVLALRMLLAGAAARTINICSGQGHAVTEVIRLVAKITGRRIAVTRADRRPGDPVRVVGDNRLARELIGWTPQRDLVEQITSAWHWMAAGLSRTAAVG